MRLVLFFSSIALSILIAFTSLSDVRAESQEGTQDNSISKNVSVDFSEPVKAIIEKQLRAFREYDGDKAYGYTSNHFKSQYRDGNHFMSMMRILNKPLTSHVSYTFLDQSQVGSKLVQKVAMMNKDGTSVIMMIYLTENERGTWLIDGYTLLDSTDAQPI